MANKDVIAMKEARVKELADHIKDAKLVLLVDYRGTTVEADTKLRKNIREVNGELKVIKNNIIKRALDANNESGLDDVLEGPTAVVSAKEDYLQPLKAIYKFSKENENYKIKGGHLLNYHQEKNFLQNLLEAYLELFQNLLLHLTKLRAKKKQKVTLQ